VLRRVSPLAVIGAALVGSVLVTGTAEAATDPLLSEQWGISTINAPTAWTTATGRGVVVAVIDSGAGPHPDLDANLLPGSDLRSGFGWPDGSDVGAVGHGTHVAGTIAAVAGNGVGITGVAPNAKILPLRILGSDGSGSTRDLAIAIGAAVTAGARVINLSLGSVTDDPRVAAAVADAAARNVLVIAAAGNDGPTGSPKWPAMNDFTVAVTALDRDGNPAASGQRGGYIDIGAPGVGILSTVPAAMRGRDYEMQSGSSMAAAFVSGTAAILMSIKPDLTVPEAREILLVTARDVGAPGRDDATGSGMVDAAAAVAELIRRYPHSLAATLAGEPVVGAVYSVRPAGVTSVRWVRCNEAGAASTFVPASCRPIPDATGTEYVTRPRDAQRFIRAVLEGPTGTVVTPTSPRVMAIVAPSPEVASGSPLAETFTTQSKGTPTYTLLNGECLIRRGTLVARATPATCRVRVRVSARAPYPALNTVLTVVVVAP